MSIINFDFMNFILKAFILLFITAGLGLLFGKIQFGKFNFGSSGALFVGLLVGWGAYTLAQRIYETGDENAAGMSAATQIMESNGGNVINTLFFSASLIIFVATVGLLAAKDLKAIIKKYGPKFIILGFLITLVGAGGTYLSTAIVKDTNPFAVTGVYTGAMTSSPGLAASLEAAEDRADDMAQNYPQLSQEEKEVVVSVLKTDSKYADLDAGELTELTAQQQTDFVNSAVSQVGIGSAVAYPFGVIIVILAVNFLNVIFKFDLDEEKRRYKIEIEEARSVSGIREIPTTDFSIASFVLVCLVGYLIGSIKIYMGPLGYVSLESTGGVLIGSLLLGYIGKIGPISFRMDPKTLVMLREFGLTFFLSIVGLNYGYGAIDAVIHSGVILALESLIVGAIAIMAGFIVGRYVFKLNWIVLSGAICGGMTSTPGLGAATDACGSDDPASGYGATYPFALFGMVVFTIVLMKLPLL